MHVFNYRITTDYDLNLKWYDPRLIFRNLKPDETFNDLGKPKCVLNKDLSIMASMIIAEVFLETAAGMYARAVLSFQPKFGGVFPRVLQNLATFILFF